MSDELECFRKAAELGCPDFHFETFDGVDWKRFKIPSSITAQDPWHAYLPSPDPMINRYAAAVCAEWWNEQAQQCREGALRLEAGCGGFSYDHWLKIEGLDRVDELCGVYGKYNDLRAEAEHMILAARAFGKKYGAA